MRPDLVFPVGMPGAIDQTLLSGELTRLLDIDRELDAVGWSGETLHEFAPLLNPPTTPDIDPSRVVTFVGTRDKMAPTRTARVLLDEWGVPAQNRTEWDCGHFGVLARLIRTDEFQKRVRQALDTASQDERSEAVSV
jgi:hypothetical protein